MATARVQKTVLPPGYLTLRRKVEATLRLTEKRVKQELFRAYWQTGKYIHEYVLQHKKRADYRTFVIRQLSEDLGVSRTILYDSLQLAKRSPIVPARGQLTWTLFRRLQGVEDPRQRSRLLERIERSGLNTRQLETKIKRESLSKSAREKQKKPLPAPAVGPFWTYRILDSESIHSKRKGVLWVDLGFHVYLEAERFESQGLKALDIASSSRDVNGIYTLTKAPELTAADLFTYKAFIEKVVDADTLNVQIDLGFSCWTRLTLRLSGIDAPEITSARGKRAKAFVERELKKEPFITLKSTKDDKYRRYLADIFYASGQHLNQILLDESLAVRM